MESMSEQTQALPGALPLGTTPAGARSGPDLLSSLEERVTRLVERHREAKAAVHDLQAQLRDRDSEIAELQRRIAALAKARSTALERLDSVIDEMERIEKSEGASA
jgi:TolA-binding protein